ncbi:hypothetical protein [Streptomyces sp. NPDC056358]|uniref:hypothetical protein n=1 Tax=Streptomyces sp. NPDC056358 TaxID=3345794 RepID=UPI0035DA0405
MIKPEAIPQYTGKLEQLEKDHAGLKTDAGHIRDTGSSVHTHFQGLSAYYKAPEAEQLFASTKPVKDRADGFADDLEKVASSLSDYATEIRPLVTKLEQLKADATKFVNANKDDDDWEYDEDKVDEHNQLRDDITATVAAFWAAERTCHNKITALIPGGVQMVAGDGSERKDQYGFNADDLKNAKLPWGDPVEEKHHVWEVGHWVKSFVWDGLIVDGVWGTIKGLGTLVGFGGWDAMGQAWKGLAQLATGLVITAIPGAGTLFWALPDDKLPSWLRDSRTAMKETGKALVAWDEWGKNPGRAAGAVTFNVLTTVFTGGAGGAAAGAGKAGAVAKALSVAGKAGKVIDPMTYIAKGTGAGLSKIGDITKGLKGISNIEIPKLPDDAITLPEGSFKLPDGTVHLPEGAAIPEGGVKLPDGNVKFPNDVPVLPENTTKLPTHTDVPVQYFDHDGNLLNEHGDIVQRVEDAPKEGSPNVPHTNGTDPTTPHTNTTDPVTPHTPGREPALVGVGAHTADNVAHAGANAGDNIIHVGSDLTDPAHLADNLPGTHNPADNLPTGHVGDNLPGIHNPADNLPGGHVGDNLPGGHADDLGHGPSAGHEPPTGGHGGHGGDGPNGPHDPTPPHHNDHGPNSHADDAAHHGTDEGAPHHDSESHDPGSIHGNEGNASDGQSDGGSHHDGGSNPEPIQIGDTPMPPPGPGQKVLGVLPEDLVRRTEDGLISHVGDQPINKFMDQLSHQRAENYLRAKEAGTFPRSRTGACVGSVIDLRTGKVIEGINGPKKAPELIGMDQLHPTLLERYEQIADAPPHHAPILAHAEVKAANELLWARKELGLPDDAAALTEMRASVQFPFMIDDITGKPPRPAPFCGNCNHMLEGVPSSFGRFLKDPPGPENWIP